MTNKNVMGTAREWLVTMRTAANPDLLRSQFEAWVLEDPEHLRAYARAESEWIRLDKAVNLLRQKGAMPPGALLKEIQDTAECTRRRRALMKQVRNWSIGLASASTVILLLIYIARTSTF
jgi:ferric-dicitrate binding protein FerR (iron transport regulator)